MRSRYIDLYFKTTLKRMENADVPHPFSFLNKAAVTAYYVIESYERKIQSMNEKIKLSVIGGDARQSAAARRLESCGFDCAVFGTDVLDGQNLCRDLAECLKDTKAVILGVPFSNDGHRINCKSPDYAVSLRSLYERLAPRSLILGGKVTPEAQSQAALYGVRFLDYLEREEVNIHNAVPTAEGAIEIAMRELPVTLFGSRSAVLGYGRVGRALAERLKALGSDVTVVVRKERDAAWCRASGFKTLGYSSLDSLRGFDVIFNTVPAKVLSGAELSAIGNGSLIIDLASKPGGVDMESARELGCRVIWALSLPGKVAVQTAGEIIADSVLSILREEGLV